MALCGPSRDYPASPHPPPMTTTLRTGPSLAIPRRSPMTNTLRTGRTSQQTLADPFTLRTDLSMTSVRTSPPLLVQKWHQRICNSYPTDPSMPTLPCGSPHAYPMDLTLPCGSSHEIPTEPPTPTLRTPSTGPSLKRPLDDPAGPHDCRKGTPPSKPNPSPAGGAVATPGPQGSLCTPPCDELDPSLQGGPSGKTSQARSASQSPGPEREPPFQKKSAPPGPGPRGKPGGCDARLAWAITKGPAESTVTTLLDSAPEPRGTLPGDPLQGFPRPSLLPSTLRTPPCLHNRGAQQPLPGPARGRMAKMGEMCIS